MPKFGEGIIEVGNELNLVIIALEVMKLLDEGGGIGDGYLFVDEGSDEWGFDIGEIHEFLGEVSGRPHGLR